MSARPHKQEICDTTACMTHTHILPHPNTHRNQSGDKTNDINQAPVMNPDGIAVAPR
ncbi:hypothetical protein WUBG_00250 [Wuchereria bancrofti]|uniref:Uncharacterized protein n=1 Tax=Wuchereria bancrofti TaxID=6293 RepID=J9F2U1_WUCBA|nr:hypothetical protein WUBG_00250 [Wuchereria bancrofti]